MAKSCSSSLAVEIDHVVSAHGAAIHSNTTTNALQEQGTPAMHAPSVVEQRLATLPTESMLNRYLDEIRSTELTLNESATAKNMLGQNGAGKS